MFGLYRMTSLSLPREKRELRVRNHFYLVRGTGKLQEDRQPRYSAAVAPLR
jgi:hypothetical protein